MSSEPRVEQLFELFPTPVLFVPGVIPEDKAASLAARLNSQARTRNRHSGELAHSHLLGPGDDHALDHLVSLLGTHIQRFGNSLLGEPLRWLVKEIWLNVMAAGGQQSIHNHANSMVSGVVYLTSCDDAARTVFLRGMGGGEFVLRNTHAAMQAGRFNSDKWIAPAPLAGDLILFPSYLLHQVPVNSGGERVSLAFNAIPERLDAWGYTLSFQP